MARVGIIGAGNMGSAFARLLMKHDIPIAVHSRRHDTCAALAVETGGETAGSVAELVDQTEIVLGCLRDRAAIEEMYFGRAGLAVAKRSTTVVELSTLGPEMIADLQSQVVAAGHDFVYAAVAGMPMDVAAGRALVLVAGPAAAVEAVLPVISKLGTVERVGEHPEGAAAMKLAFNMMVFASICSISEAMVAAERSGIARARAFDLLAASPGAPAMLRYRREQFVNPATATVQATIGNAAMVSTAICEMLDRLGLTLPQANLTAATFAAAVDAGHGTGDVSRMAEYIKEQHASA